LERLLFKYEGKGQRCRVKWKTHNIRVELSREDAFGTGYPAYNYFELYVDNILRDSRHSKFIPYDWLGSSGGPLTYKIVEDGKEILLECYLQAHYTRCPTAVPISEKIWWFFGGFVDLLTASRKNSVYRYGIVLHVGADMVYSSAKWAKAEISYKVL